MKNQSTCRQRATAGTVGLAVGEERLPNIRGAAKQIADYDDLDTILEDPARLAHKSSPQLRRVIQRALTRIRELEARILELKMRDPIITKP